MNWWWILTLWFCWKGEQRWRLEVGRFKISFDACINTHTPTPTCLAYTSEDSYVLIYKVRLEVRWGPRSADPPKMVKHDVFGVFSQRFPRTRFWVLGRCRVLGVSVCFHMKVLGSISKANAHHYSKIHTTKQKPTQTKHPHNYSKHTNTHTTKPLLKNPHNYTKTYSNKTSTQLLLTINHPHNYSRNPHNYSYSKNYSNKASTLLKILKHPHNFSKIHTTTQKKNTQNTHTTTQNQR